MTFADLTKEKPMQPYRRWRNTLRRLINQSAAAGRYWTIEANTWQTMVSDAEKEDVRLLDLLKDMHYTIADRGQDGSVHLG